MTMKNSITIPNGITIGRLFLGLIGICIARNSEWFVLGLGIYFILGMLPDALDGYVARKYNQKSRLGEFLDPLADKILFYVAIFVLFPNLIWWSVLVPLAVCDTISTVVHFFKTGGAVWAGKWKFMLQNSALILLVIASFVNKKIINLEMEVSVSANIVLITALLCATYSLYHRTR
jgi:phosphatidylglycerophosphate synthase